MRQSFFLIILFILTLTSCHQQKGITVTTYAGTGKMGAADGKATESSFSNPMGLSIDANNNLYVADSRNNLIRKISADGIVTTLAGSGEAGASDGQGKNASFFFPTALAVDKQGNVFVADTHNNLIRKITPEGAVTTIAGKTSVKFDNPDGIAVDSNGNIMVADWNDMIRKIDAHGEVTDFAGHQDKGSVDGLGAQASFYIPQGLAFDKKGNLYVADSYNNKIRKIEPNGQVTTFAGKQKRGNSNGRADSASFFRPDGIAIDNLDTIYIADTGNHLIRKIDRHQMVTTLAGNGTRGATNGNAATASFWQPMGIALDAAGNVYVADYQNNLIRKIIKN